MNADVTIHFAGSEPLARAVLYAESTEKPISTPQRLSATIQDATSADGGTEL